ncbi:hypothetical protein B4135_2251 [Caldibacillus debilis]|uniref:Uncharacterized protein n=1 Tax=Caldibacillus debilis TaxID=301148 RepID=A0A150M2A4_9BACI|nr:hypothetical protein B4135_2251 [Caldibacillus debilis]
MTVRPAGTAARAGSNGRPVDKEAPPAFPCGSEKAPAVRGFYLVSAGFTD